MFAKYILYELFMIVLFRTKLLDPYPTEYVLYILLIILLLPLNLPESFYTFPIL